MALGERSAWALAADRPGVAFGRHATDLGETAGRLREEGAGDLLHDLGSELLEHPIHPALVEDLRRRLGASDRWLLRRRHRGG